MTNVPDDISELDEDGRAVFETLVYFYEETTKNSAKSAHVAEHVEMNTKEVAQYMRTFREMGAISTWGGSTPATWILFPDDPPGGFRPK